MKTKMKTKTFPCLLVLTVAMVLIGCQGPETVGPTDTQKELDWWPTKATPQPVDDARPNYNGQWWWPMDPAEEASQLWGNRGYVYVLKWTKTEARVPIDLKPVEALTLTSVHFAFDNSALTPVAQEILKDAVERLKQYPNAHLTIEGHTCSIGTDTYNKGLGMRRATAVKTFLESQGIGPERLTAVSYGETRRKIEKERKASDYALNRRVEFGIDMQGQ